METQKASARVAARPNRGVEMRNRGGLDLIHTDPAEEEERPNRAHGEKGERGCGTRLHCPF